MGAKALDYADFCKGIEIINSKEHLTQEGLNKFNTLLQHMNSKRTNFEGYFFKQWNKFHWKHIYQPPLLKQIPHPPYRWKI